MSRRGKNHVKRSIVREATGAVFGDSTPPKVTTNNFNPLFHYLQTMFPNYDNAVLHSVLEQEGNSVEKAIDVLLAFAVPQEPINKEPETDEIAFLDDFSDTELPPNVFALPVPPSHNSGRDHASLYEYQQKKLSVKPQRPKRRQALQKQKQKQQQEAKKKVKWVPLQDFIVEHRNPFAALEHFGDELRQIAEVEKKEEVAVLPEDDESQALLTQEEIEESWKQFEEATAVADEALELDSRPSDLDLDVDTNAADTTNDSCGDDFFGEADWSSYAAPTDCSTSISEEECGVLEDFVFVEERKALEVEQREPLLADSAAFESFVFNEPLPAGEKQVVVKLYYSSSDIHRLGLKRSAFTFAKLHDYAETYLNSKCQLLAKSTLPRAFALTYVDDEGDIIHLCSEEELDEALRLHEEVFWVEGKQPILRLHIKSLEVSVHDGHITVVA